jgi:hypothetical protein
MNILILKTNINSNGDFLTVRNKLSGSHSVTECTIDLEDKDKVLRIIGDKLNLQKVTSQVISLGFSCEELLD